jgi:hypothetical protein
MKCTAEEKKKVDLPLIAVDYYSPMCNNKLLFLVAMAWFEVPIVVIELLFLVARARFKCVMS